MKKIVSFIAKKTGLYTAAVYLYSIYYNRLFHNHNRLFYTLSPALLRAIAKSFNILKDKNPSLLENGAYYEFGLFKGFSLHFAEISSRELCAKTFKIFGFDSFKGLPSTEIDGNPYWKAGNYQCSKEDVMTNLSQHGADLNRIVLTEGFFSEELFSAFAKEYGGVITPSIMVIDSDIYESCKTILNFFGRHLVKGSVLLFDDFHAFDRDNQHGERRALQEYKMNNPSFELTHLFDFGKYGSAFEVS